MADHAADHSHGHHVHGTMDTRVQEKTFAGFVSMTTWGIGLIIVVLVFMALAGA